MPRHCSPNLAKMECSLKVAKDVIDEHGAVFLNTQQVFGTRPAQVDHMTAVPLKQQQEQDANRE